MINEYSAHFILKNKYNELEIEQKHTFLYKQEKKTNHWIKKIWHKKTI